LGGDQTKLNGAGHELEALAHRLFDFVLVVEVLASGEVLDLSGDADGQVADVEGGDGADAAAAMGERVPDGGRVVADGRQRARAGDDGPPRNGHDSGPTSVEMPNSFYRSRRRMTKDVRRSRRRARAIASSVSLRRASAMPQAAGYLR